MILNENPFIRKMQRAYLVFLGCLLAYTGLWFLVFVAAAVLMILTVTRIFLTMF